MRAVVTLVLHTIPCRLLGHVTALRELQLLVQCDVYSGWCLGCLIPGAAYRGGARTARQAAACQLLCNYAGSLDGTLALMKSPFLTEATPALQSALLRSEDVTASQIIRVCSAMASHSTGQRQLLRTPGAPAFIDVVGEYGGHPRLQLSFTAMLELLRNLAFLYDNKPFYLADPR